MTGTKGTGGKGKDWDVMGDKHQTRSLTFSKDKENQDKKRGPAHIEWKGGDAWQLRRIRIGNDPWALPGHEALFDADTLEEARSSGRAVIVVGGQHSGLSSFRNWLTREDKIGAKVIDLTDARLAAPDTEGQLRGIASRLCRKLDELRKPTDEDDAGDDGGKEKPPDEDDPIELLRWIAESTGSGDPPTLVFNGFGALEKDTALRFFGRIRALYEIDVALTRRLGLVFLGRSISQLDPSEAGPFSTLLSTAEVWTTTPLHRDQMKELAELHGELEADELKKLVEWTGGEPLLVQAVLQCLREPENNAGTVADATGLLARERLPAFDTWKHDLKKRLRKKPELESLVHRLLRYGSLSNERRLPRMPLLELLIGGWIRAEPDGVKVPREWKVASDARKLLMSEAYAER